MTLAPAAQPSTPVRNEPRNEHQPEHARQNVGDTERWVSVALGSTMALLGLRRMSLGGLATAGLGAALVHRGITGHCHGYKLLGVNTTDRADPQDYYEDGVHVEQSFSVNKPAAELYRFWRDFTNLPRFMRHLERVEVMDDTRSRWTAKAPMGRTVSWDAEIINEVPDQTIAWRSLEGADVHNTGSVRFVETPDRGTQVRVVVDYIPPAGTIGKWTAKLLGEEPEQQIREDLRRFKRLMEAGEIPETQGQPMGTCGR